jgi:hypothetical protein
LQPFIRKLLGKPRVNDRRVLSGINGLGIVKGEWLSKLIVTAGGLPD